MDCNRFLCKPQENLNEISSNGTSVAYTYNELRGWPSLISDTTSSGSASYALTYASGANTVPLITGVTESNGSTVGYNYDALYRLTSDTRTGTNPFSGSYAYNLEGYPTSYNGVSYSYTGGDLLSTAAYDGDGNPTAGTFGGHSSTLTWNDSNELTAFTNSIATITNGYKANGLRGWSEVGSGAKTYYVYSGGVLLGEVSATGSPISAYTWGNGLISEHRYDTSSPTSFWYLFGPQGETRYLTNSTGAVTDTYTYSAYGEPVASTGTDTNPFRYGGSVGYYSDSNTGLILCGQRWYDPTTGRWLNSDPIGYDGGSDLYAYCGDNPVGGLDPSGEQEYGGPVRMQPGGGRYWLEQPKDKPGSGSSGNGSHPCPSNSGTSGTGSGAPGKGGVNGIGKLPPIEMSIGFGGIYQVMGGAGGDVSLNIGTTGIGVSVDGYGAVGVGLGLIGGLQGSVGYGDAGASGSYGMAGGGGYIGWGDGSVSGSAGVTADTSGNIGVGVTRGIKGGAGGGAGIGVYTYGGAGHQWGIHW
jgi:RHS repeat-associated protein